MESNSIRIVTFNLRCVWQGIRIATAFFHHPANPADLSLNPVQPINQRLYFFRRPHPSYGRNGKPPYGHFLFSNTPRGYLIVPPFTTLVKRV